MPECKSCKSWKEMYEAQKELAKIQRETSRALSIQLSKAREELEYLKAKLGE
jgi:hypothetical protein